MGHKYQSGPPLKEFWASVNTDPSAMLNDVAWPDESNALYSDQDWGELRFPRYINRYGFEIPRIPTPIGPKSY